MVGAHSIAINRHNPVMPAFRRPEKSARSAVMATGPGQARRSDAIHIPSGGEGLDADARGGRA
jgi:hypothetical protein